MSSQGHHNVERRDDRSSREWVSRLGKTFAEVESATRDLTPASRYNKNIFNNVALEARCPKEFEKIGEPVTVTELRYGATQMSKIPHLFNALRDPHDVWASAC